MAGLRSTQEWKRLSARAIARDPLCRLRLPGCTGLSETGDHIIPVSIRPELALVESNIQGACKSCNNKRGNRDLDSFSRPRALAFFD